MSGGGETQVVRQTGTSAPWSDQQPYIKRGFEEAEKIYESDKPQYFPESTVVPLAPETEQALNITKAEATSPDSVLSRAYDETGATLRGDYLSPDNEVYKGLLKGVSREVRPQVDSGFARSGRFGSPLHAEAMAKGVTQGMLPYIGDERNRMSQAVTNAYPVSQYAPRALGTVGATREGQARSEMQDQIDRYNFEQNADAMKLSQFMSQIGGNVGRETINSTQQPIYSNPLMQGLGAASSLAGIGQAAFAPAGGGGFMTK